MTDTITHDEELDIQHAKNLVRHLHKAYEQSNKLFKNAKREERAHEHHNDGKEQRIEHKEEREIFQLLHLLTLSTMDLLRFIKQLEEIERQEGHTNIHDQFKGPINKELRHLMNEIRQLVGVENKN